MLHRKAAEKPTESAEEVLSERSEAGFGERSEVPSSGASCAPWSSGNNCTPHRFLAELYEVHHGDTMVSANGAIVVGENNTISVEKSLCSSLIFRGVHCSYQ